MRARRPVRCGWCSTGHCDACLVIMLMGETRSKSDKKTAGPYVWRCPCGCDRSQNTKCLDCQRVGVETEQNRCTDTDGCKRFRRYPGRVRQPPVREVRV